VKDFKYTLLKFLERFLKNQILKTIQITEKAAFSRQPINSNEELKNN